MELDKLLQKSFICILNPLYSITQKVDKRIRDRFVYILIFCIIFFINATRSPVLRDPYIYSFLRSNLSQYTFCTILFALLCILSIDRKLEEVDWRKVEFYTAFLLGLAMIIVSFIHPVGEGYRLFGFQIAFLFPAFYLIWNNRGDYEKLFRCFAYSMVIGGLIIFIVTFGSALKGNMITDGPRYCGIMANANCFSLVGFEMYLGALYLVATERITISKLFIYSASAGVGIGIILLGQMRIAVLAIVVCSIFTIFFKRRYFREPIDKTRLLYWLFALVITLGSVKAAHGLADINNRALAIKNPEEVQTEQDADILDRFAINDDKGIEQYSSGRAWIWKNYARHLNLLGNNYDNFNKEEMTGPHFGYAHNVFLEMGYRFGVPIAVWYLLYMLINGIVCLFYLFAASKRKKKYLLFPIIAAIVFVLESLLDCALLPFFQPEALMYYMSLVTVIDRRGAA